MQVANLLVCLSVCLTVKAQFLNRFAVVFDGDRTELELVAQSLGFEFAHELKYSGIFLLRHSEVAHRSKRSAVQQVDILRSHPRILYANQEEVLLREKRYIIHDKQLEMPLRDIKDNSVYQRVSEARLSARSQGKSILMDFVDPLFQDQWSLFNYGQSGGKVGMDLNLEAAWKAGYNGEGVVVCILDDGIYHNHTDLINNYDPKASTDLNDLTDAEGDPMPDMSTDEKEAENRHGTWCAGEIAASAHNNACGVGAAFGCKIGGVRLIDGDVTDAMEAEALNFNIQYIDIFSSSWGPPDTGRSMEGPRSRAAAALRKGVRKGRNGKGTIYVWATGNGGSMDDDCGADGYVSSIETMSFGSVTDRGTKPYFMEQCTSTLAVVPSGGEEVAGEEDAQGITKLKVVTTDLNDGCIENFQGTSSSAPLAAACVALSLQANSELTWRDVQHIVVHSSRIPSVDHSWIINGAGHHISHTFGFGVLDCSRMVQLAGTWNNVPEQHKCVNQRKAVNKFIPSGGRIVDEVLVGCVGQAHKVTNLEHVQVHIKLDHSRRGDIQLYIVSPSNTWSQILSTRSRDNSDKGIDFTFLTVHSWGETAEGKWSLHVIDNPGKSGRVNTGQLLEWTLILYGTDGKRVDRMEPKSKTPGQAHFPTLVEVERTMKIEEERANNANLTPLEQLSNNVLEGGLNARLIQELISAFDTSPASQYHVLNSEKKTELPTKRYDGEDTVLKEERKSLHTNKKMEDDMIDRLVDAVERELISDEEMEREEKRIRERHEKEERYNVQQQRLNDLVKRLETETLSHGDQNTEGSLPRQNVNKYISLRQLQELTKITDTKKETDQRTEMSRNKEVRTLLEEVRTALEEESQQRTREKEDGEERLSTRDLADLLHYLNEMS